MLINVVSNTSPIIFLSKIEALDLLPQCFDKIFIPQAVAKELRDLSSPDYIECTEISIAGANFVLGALDARWNLHAGELEAIVLAQEIQADYVIMDDRLARRKAQSKGLKTIGTIGVLLFAHQQQFISTSEIDEYLIALTQTHGMYISPKILTEVKKSIQNNILNHD
jgi:predicted nucleic acid-binding protein